MTNAQTESGRTLGENVEGFEVFNDVIRPLDQPLVASDSLAVLRGNLAPKGAVIKPPVAKARLHRHAGRAIVLDDYNEMAARIDDPDLDVDADSVLVLRNAGPLGAPGMPAAGPLPGTARPAVQMCSPNNSELGGKCCRIGDLLKRIDIDSGVAT
jgi:dihydroxyacid dehydratase/phosphogluconate dehydratase